MTKVSSTQWRDTNYSTATVAPSVGLRTVCMLHGAARPSNKNPRLLGGPCTLRITSENELIIGAITSPPSPAHGKHI
jgi:hypothetical protein